MKFRIWLVSVLGVLPACSSIIDAHTQKQEMMSSYMTGNHEFVTQKISGKLEDCEETGDELMWRLEAGSFAFHKGDYQESLKHFNAAELQFKAYDDEAVITLRDGVYEGGSAMVNQNILPYRGFSRDRIMTAVYRSLIYFAVNDPDGALVELRKLRYIQEDVRKKYKAEIDAEQKQNAEQQKENQKKIAGMDEKFPSMKDISAQVEKDTGYTAHRASLAQLASKGYGNFLNPFAVYLSGVGCLLEGDENNAAVDFKRLYEIQPQNPLVCQLYATLLSRSASAIPDALKPAAPLPGTHDLARRVHVVFANGRGLAYKEFKLELVLPYLGYTGFAIPITETYSAPFRDLTVTAGGQSVRTVTLADMDAIAAQEYQTRLPVVITRTIITYLTKEIASRAAVEAAIAATEDDDGSSQALAVLFAYLGTGVYKYITNTGDTRCWEMLPKNYQIAQVPLPPDRKISLVLGGRKFDFTLKTSTQAAFIYVSAPSAQNIDCKLFEINRLPR